ncbi:type III secretion system export apparatus subunit SctU [Luteimonas sp. SDU101]|uniref:type III secretion system export apparatus subunit SctU n=1 Tax=unclassified Luteimonas TaxID=2629088 RepID=UPI003EB7E6DD
MADKDQGADKTEKPTPKKIRDARKEGNVARSKELTGTVLLLGWIALGGMLASFIYGRLAGLFNQSLQAVGQDFHEALPRLGQLAFETLLWICLPLLAMVLALGVVIEFLQVGPVLSIKKITPKMDKMNPVEGVKRMFSMDNLVELVKSVLKCAALIGIGYIVLRGMMEWLLKLPYAPPSAMAAAFWHGVKWIAVWTIAVFFLVSALDVWYQKFSYTRKLRMSRRDIRQELKENEGDPYVKQRRRQLHQEWAQQNMLTSVRKSNVVVTNPTHIAVALQYEPGETELPVVVAKGEGAFAELIKKTAEEEGIPILQNVPLARGLNEQVELDDYISGEFFDAVAEVLHWAENVRRARGDDIETVYREPEAE